MRVRDNGKGIDPQVLESGGLAGHHGWPGMHERARLAGGSLAVWSKLGAGTEIELTISAAIAYRKVNLPHVPKAVSFGRVVESPKCPPTTQIWHSDKQTEAGDTLCVGEFPT
jgi:hypothetical protein